MTDDMKTAPIEPVTVTVIGGTGEGSPLTTGTIGTTPDHQPNLRVNVVPTLVAVVVRSLHLFFLTLSGSLVTEHSLRSSVIVALGATGLGVVKDCVTVFGGLEKKFPLLSGSV